jgi:hypothetical protein
MPSLKLHVRIGRFDRRDHNGNNIWSIVLGSSKHLTWDSERPLWSNRTFRWWCKYMYAYARLIEQRFRGVTSVWLLMPTSVTLSITWVSDQIFHCKVLRKRLEASVSSQPLYLVKTAHNKLPKKEHRHLTVTYNSSSQSVHYLHAVRESRLLLITRIVAFFKCSCPG